MMYFTNFLTKRKTDSRAPVLFLICIKPPEDHKYFLLIGLIDPDPVIRKPDLPGLTFLVGMYPDPGLLLTPELKRIIQQLCGQLKGLFPFKR